MIFNNSLYHNGINKRTGSEPNRKTDGQVTLEAKIRSQELVDRKEYLKQKYNVLINNTKSGCSKKCKCLKPVSFKNTTHSLKINATEQVAKQPRAPKAVPQPDIGDQR